MTPQILQIGMITPRMLSQYEGHVILHRLAEIEDLETFLTEIGPSIAGVSTSGSDGLDPAIMDRLPNLKMVTCFGVGYDGVDVKRAVERGIMVTHTPDVLNNDVANVAIMHLLAVSRNLVHDAEWARSGQWKAKGIAPLTRSVEGKPVGVVGMGRIGQRIAEKLKAFDCQVHYHTRNQRPDLPWQYHADLVEMARAVDYLIVITPGGAATHHLINRAVMDALGPDGTLINVSRGSVVDQTALIEALQDGRLGFAGLDVLEDEPNIPPELLAMDNVLITPHVGSATIETRTAMGDLTTENLLRFFAEGQVTTPVPECAHMPAAR